jgi:hypothetical protein
MELRKATIYMCTKGIIASSINKKKCLLIRMSITLSLIATKNKKNLKTMQ